jgi:hypothetical protein
MHGSVGLPVDSSNHVVSSSLGEAGEAVVGDEEADQQGVSADSDRVVRELKLDWRKIFDDRPDLSPPGYEQAVAATKLKVEERKLRQRNKPEAVDKKPAKGRRKK